MNNALGALLNLDPSTMTESQKQAYSNLMGTLVSGVTSAVGGDAAAAQLATKVEEDNNYLDPAQRIFGFDAVNNQLARLQGHALTREQYEKRLMELAPTSDQMNQKMIADCLGGKASCGTQKAQAQEYMGWIKSMEAKGFITPGKFGNGTAEALKQVETVNRPPKYNVPQPASQNLGIGVLLPAHMQGVANNSQTSQALGYQNSMNNIGYTGAIVAGSPYIAGPTGYGIITASGGIGTSQVVGAVLGAVSNAGAQYANNNTDNNKDGIVDWKDIDKTDVFVGATTGLVGVNYRWLGNIVTNEVGYVASNALNGDLGKVSLAGATATAGGTSLGYGAGKVFGATQWRPVTTATGTTTWQLPSTTDRYLPIGLSWATTTSAVPSQVGTFVAPHVQEFSTPVIQQYVTEPLSQKYREVKP